MARTAAPQASTLEHTVREPILEVLRETNGVVAGPRGAAVRLGLKRTTLQSKMEKLGMAQSEPLPPSPNRHRARTTSCCCPLLGTERSRASLSALLA
jgi:hypothetical protein